DVTIGDTELLLPSYVNYSSFDELKEKLTELHISEGNYNPLLLQIYKKMLVRMIIKADKESDEDTQIEELFDDLSKIGSRKEALEYYLESIGIKDSIPKNLPKSVSECHILRIANNVKFIKDTLRLKSLPDKTSIVHYTSLHNTKFFLPMYQGNTFKPSKAKLKLYNVAYMNDPEEGRVLNRFLDRKHKTKGLLLNDQAQINSVYLFSLSLKEDYLPMWTQYGKNGSGVCIYFKNDNFEIGRHSSNDYLKILQEEIKDGNKLPLYRVCYLDCEKKKNSAVFVDGIDSKDKKQIKRSLNEIEKAIEGLKKRGIRNLDWINFINNIINEIRYLFKSVSYRHEREIRLMKYLPNELNDKVKLENREGSDIRLYFEYSQPILIRKIIFGPKAERTEVLKPYIKYCDPNIEIKHSTIKYR
ncbi:MAG: DUF2971 domain-containing protein, partial [Aerococcaceae bacterium]|nr:DUF2971 domain-containing protein [Aerococcaceae bacterium]